MCVDKPFKMTLRSALFWRVQCSSTAESENPQALIDMVDTLEALPAGGRS